MKTLLTCLLGLWLTAAAAWGFEVTAPTVEYAHTPLGIDVARPRFGWQMQSSRAGAAQRAYQLSVVGEDGREVWNSGRVSDSRSVAIAYGGGPLLPATRYDWTVTVWDDRGEKAQAASWFETGLMSSTDTSPAWSGAQWIGSSTPPFYSQYLPVFRLACTVTMERGCQSASLLYGANDHRLMDANKNILGVVNAPGASYIRMELTDTALNVYRVGYTQKDRADAPLRSFALKDLDRSQPHRLEIASLAGTTDVTLDGTTLGRVELNPMGRGGDYIAFPVVGDIGFCTPAGQSATFSQIAVAAWRQPRHTLSTLPDTRVSGRTIIVTPQETGQPVLRTTFSTDGGKRVAKARLYATARGEYEVTLDGRQVSDDYLSPGLTQYNKTLTYQTYDLTPLLRAGSHELRFTLGEGWWSGGLSYDLSNWNYFGDRPSLLAKVVVTYTDGSVQTLVSEPQQWQCSTEGPVRCGSLFQGEVYDARRETIAHWRPATVVALDSVVSHERNSWPTPDDYSHFRLVAQTGPAVHPFTTLTALAVDEVRPGVYVYDMGQNMAGVPRITFSSLPAGTTVRMRFAEVRYPDLPAYGPNVGMVMMENIRAAMAQDTYIARGGGLEVFQPRHTYHGYRYVEVTGLPAPLPVEQVQGVVLSSVERLTASYCTSDTLLNRLFKNVEWSTLANMLSVPTDCPQRNERMGWSGDLSVFSPAMTYLTNAAPFLERHLTALRDTQTPDGAFADIAPIGGGFGGPLWQSVGVVVPWQCYVQYADEEALRTHYPAMQRYIDYLLRTRIDTADAHYRTTGEWGELGDWLGFEMKRTDKALLFDSYLAYELRLMARMARVLGHEADARRYDEAAQQRTAYLSRHTLQTLPDAQTACAVPLALGVVEEQLRRSLADHLATLVATGRQGDDGRTYPPYSLMTGFAGCSWVSLALSEGGHTDVAYRQLLNRAFPSWLYPVTQGATTIWERLNSMTREEGFGRNNSMNSFNHYAFGSVANWLMQRSLGIARDEASPAFHHFILRPEPDPTGGLRFARGHYDSPYGRIESAWERHDNGTVTYRFTLPANTTATLQLPGQQPRELTAGQHTISTEP